MASSSSANEAIKLEDSPEPTSLYSPAEIFAASSTPPHTATSLLTDPKDPEGFLRRCSGYNKKTRARCSAVIGKNAKSSHPTFLPTCHAHRDQHTFAGWCQFKEDHGERCGRLFRWTPPYFELCADHQGHPDTPCHFMGLPLELRQEIFRYLLPTQAIGSSSSPLHCDTAALPLQGPSGPMNAVLASRRASRHNTFAATPSTDHRLFPYPILDLLLVSRRIHDELKDLLYSSIPFTIDIRKDGTFMCGRRLLEPRRADGSAHFTIDDAESAAKKFTSTFDFAAVKNYNVDIMVENWTDDNFVMGHHSQQGWDEEVEIYDIRDYVGVVVSGILSKSRNLCRLNVRLGLSKFKWEGEELIANTKCLVGPFERLRNVRQPKFVGVYDGMTPTNFMVNVPFNSLPHPSGGPTGHYKLRIPTPLCSVPRLPTHILLLGPGNPKFDEYKEHWESRLSEIAKKLPGKPPIRAMFTEFKQFYTKLSALVPQVHRYGKNAFLHRARVARENENVEAFRHLRNELIEYWHLYLEQEEQKKRGMDAHLSRMLDSDIYPSHEVEPLSSQGSSNIDPDCMIVDAITIQDNRKGKSQKRAIQDVMETCSEQGSIQTCPSNGINPQQLLENQSMSLNPNRDQHLLANRMRLQQQAAAQQAHFARVQARFQAQAQAQAQARVNAQAQHSAFRPDISTPQAIMMPNMPSQQTMQPIPVESVEVASNSNTLASSPTPVVSSSSSSWPNVGQEQSITQASSSCLRCQRQKIHCNNQGANSVCQLCESSSTECAYLTPSEPPIENVQSVSFSPIEQSGGWMVDAGCFPLQGQQQDYYPLHMMEQGQEQEQNPQYQIQLQLQQQYQPQGQQQQQQQQQHPNTMNPTAQPITSGFSTAQQSPNMQMQSDSSATVSPMSTHSVIPVQTPNSSIQSDGSTRSWILVNGHDPSISNQNYNYSQFQSYTDGYSQYQVPNMSAAPPSKKRRIDSGACVDAQVLNENRMTNRDDVVIHDLRDYERPDMDCEFYDQGYVGKGKGRAIEVEEPREAVWPN